MSKAISNLVVLISGQGTNLQAVIDAARDGVIPARVCGVVSNKSGAYGLERARLAGIPTTVHVYKKDQERSQYDGELANIVASFHPDWVILAGWMRVLSPAFLNCFSGRVVNLHPALPGMFPGTHAIERAYAAYRAGEIDHTGVMVHLVPDEGVDSGPVLNQKIVPIHPEEPLETLEERIHQVEHALLVETLRAVIIKNPKGL
jgi:phosphoribosylglycinamide formyltransferase 1